MSSKSTLYRRSHPEVYQKIVETQRIASKERYNNNEEYKQRTKENALKRYYRLKELKQSQAQP